MKARIEGRIIVVEAETDAESIAMQTLLDESEGKCTQYIMTNDTARE